MTHNGHLDARTLHSPPHPPVIDADGNWLEYGPGMLWIRRIGGEAAVEGPGPGHHGRPIRSR